MNHAALAAALLLGATIGLAAHAQAGGGGHWGFDSNAPGQPPAGFSFGRTGKGAPGRWLVRAEKDAPSVPNVLVQVSADRTGYRFPVAVANGPGLRDLKLSVSCKPVSGKVDQACGLVFRYQDENNYYITRPLTTWYNSTLSSSALARVM